MTRLAMDEAIRNAVACGADPSRIAVLDNFCWGDPTRPEIMGDLVQAAQACYDAALRYKTPFISGKDSFNNEYLGSDGKRHAIPPTLLISALGWMPDWEQALTMDLKQAGNLLLPGWRFSTGFWRQPLQPGRSFSIYSGRCAGVQFCQSGGVYARFIKLSPVDWWQPVMT